MISNFEQTQQAIERVLTYVDDLILQGKTRTEAVDHAFQRFGCQRAAVVKLLNERDYGLLGTSGDPEVSCCGTPNGMAGTA